MTSSQMTLNFNLHDDATLSNFYVGKNEPAVMCLHTSASGRGERLIYLWGINGSGRSHLLQGCCHTASNLKLTALYIPLSGIEDLKPDIFDDLEKLHLVCIDDIQNIAGNAEWEEAFFNFFNRMKDESKRLIIAGNVAPHQLGLTLPDLTSRLAGCVVFQIHELSEEEKLKALILRAKARGINLHENVAEFMFRRCQRDLSSLFDALNKIDQRSLALKRRITIPFVKEALNL